jgi:hypothetical protein
VNSGNSPLHRSHELQPSCSLRAGWSHFCHTLLSPRLSFFSFLIFSHTSSTRHQCSVITAPPHTRPVFRPTTQPLFSTGTRRVAVPVPGAASSCRLQTSSSTSSSWLAAPPLSRSPSSSSSSSSSPHPPPPRRPACSTRCHKNRADCVKYIAFRSGLYTKASRRLPSILTANPWPLTPPPPQNMRTALIVAATFALCALVSVAHAQDDLADYPIKVTRALSSSRVPVHLTPAVGGAVRELRGVPHRMREEGDGRTVISAAVILRCIGCLFFAHSNRSCHPTGSSPRSLTAPTPAPSPTARRYRRNPPILPVGDGGAVTIARR